MSVQRNKKKIEKTLKLEKPAELFVTETKDLKQFPLAALYQAAYRLGLNLKGPEGWDEKVVKDILEVTEDVSAIQRAILSAQARKMIGTNIDLKKAFTRSARSVTLSPNRVVVEASQESDSRDMQSVMGFIDYPKERYAEPVMPAVMQLGIELAYETHVTNNVISANNVDLAQSPSFESLMSNTVSGTALTISQALKPAAINTIETLAGPKLALRYYDQLAAVPDRIKQHAVTLHDTDPVKVKENTVYQPVEYVAPSMRNGRKKYKKYTKKVRSSCALMVLPHKIGLDKGTAFSVSKEYRNALGNSSCGHKMWAYTYYYGAPIFDTMIPNFRYLGSTRLLNNPKPLWLDVSERDNALFVCSHLDVAVGYNSKAAGPTYDKILAAVRDKSYFAFEYEIKMKNRQLIYLYANIHPVAPSGIDPTVKNSDIFLAELSKREAGSVFTCHVWHVHEWLYSEDCATEYKVNVPAINGGTRTVTCTFALGYDLHEERILVGVGPNVFKAPASNFVIKRAYQLMLTNFLTYRYHKIPFASVIEAAFEKNEPAVEHYLSYTMLPVDLTKKKFRGVYTELDFTVRAAMKEFGAERAPVYNFSGAIVQDEEGDDDEKWFSVSSEDDGSDEDPEEKSESSSGEEVDEADLLEYGVDDAPPDDDPNEQDVLAPDADQKVEKQLKPGKVRVRPASGAHTKEPDPRVRAVRRAVEESSNKKHRAQSPAVSVAEKIVPVSLFE